MIKPRALTQDEVRLLLIDMAVKLPSNVTVKDMLPELIRSIAAISDRISPVETADLLGIATVLSRAIAAGDHVAMAQVKIEKDTMQ